MRSAEMVQGTWKVLLALVSFLALSPAVPEESASLHPVVAFLAAADVNDFDAMQALMASDPRWTGNEQITPASFVERISNCYLRRVYSDAVLDELMASWMCDEGRGRSRVVIGAVAHNADGQVMVAILREDRNNRPAPARDGSAFAD